MAEKGQILTNHRYPSMKVKNSLSARTILKKSRLLPGHRPQKGKAALYCFPSGASSTALSFSTASFIPSSTME